VPRRSVAAKVKTELGHCLVFDQIQQGARHDLEHEEVKNKTSSIRTGQLECAEKWTVGFFVDFRRFIQTMPLHLVRNIR